MKKWAQLAVLVFWVFVQLFISTAQAVQPDEMLKDPEQEARARELSSGFRCLVCQNQSIDESDALLAKDLRALIREQIAKGETDAQITDFVVSRYGTYVLLKPQLTKGTWLLWFGPFILVLVGLYYIMRQNKKPVSVTESPLTKDEQQAIDQMMSR